MRSGTFAAASEPLVVFTSDWGSIAMGPVARDVVFVCFVGDISESLAGRCARRLERTLVGPSRSSLFLDVYSPEAVNVAARAQVVRALMARRERIESIVTLVRAPEVAIASRIATEILQAPTVVTSEPDEFNRMLVEAAPLAHERIHPDNCVPAPLMSEPPLRLVRRA